MNDMCEKHKSRHTITINDQAFLKLIDNGWFGESYSDVILRVLNKTKMDVREKRNESTD